MIYLNLACGTDYRESNDEVKWVNVDISENIKTDKIVDGFSLPYPFKDEEFDGVLAQDFLEHIPHQIFDVNGSPLKRDGFLLVMDEIWRITKKGGFLEARFPSARSVTAFIDPTHTRVLFPETFFWYTCKDQKFNFYTDRHWDNFQYAEVEDSNILIRVVKP